LPYEKPGGKTDSVQGEQMVLARSCTIAGRSKGPEHLTERKRNGRTDLGLTAKLRNPDCKPRAFKEGGREAKVGRRGKKTAKSRPTFSSLRWSGKGTPNRPP